MNVDEAEIASRWLGRTINNKYVVQSVVGNGGMAVVYAVKHRNGKRFALKMLHRELSLNNFIRQRFVREGYVANRVEHDGAVAVIDDDITDDGSAFLVMELLHGVTLERLWEANGHRLALECVLAISEQLLDVLAAAHLQNIVHRDLKPANVFVTRNGVVKILDFGIARLREGDGAKTETGTTLGTPLFMPPEQASGRSRDVDARTDLWAVGATMFSLLSGQYVHDGENSAQVLIACATTPAKSLSVVMPEAPAEIVSIIDRALAFHNEDRWESAVAMRAAVLTAQNNLGIPISREFLGRLVRATAPGVSSTDVQSTPTTTPATTPGPSVPGRTERLPFPSPGSEDNPRAIDSSETSGAMSPNVPVTNVTKLSAQAPENSSASPLKRRELAESSARAMTSPTVVPSSRSASSARTGVIVVAALALIVGVVVAIRMVVSGPNPTAAATMAARPVTEPVSVVAPPTPSSNSPPPAATATTEAPPIAEVSPVPTVTGAASLARVPAPPPARQNGRHPPSPPRGTTSKPSASPSTTTVAATPSPPPPSVSPPPPPPSQSSTPVSGRKAPPTLDRTSPFGN